MQREESKQIEEVKKEEIPAVKEENTSEAEDKKAPQKPPATVDMASLDEELSKLGQLLKEKTGFLKFEQFIVIYKVGTIKGLQQLKANKKLILSLRRESLR